MAPPAPASDRDMDGYWGPPTSTLDWCEENYVVSYYIAEFWNTVSNLAIILPPVFSMLYFAKCSKLEVETRYYVAWAFMTLVGVGSWLFHQTLLFEMQLLDELPMIYGSCALVYCIFQSDGKKQESNHYLTIAGAAYSIIVTVVYVTMQDPLLHQVAYALTVFLIIGRGLYCVRNMGMEYSTYLIMYSFILYLTAFIIWNIDNNFCSQVRTLRDSLPFPVSVLAQGHMWWHILCGIGIHFHLMFSLHMRTSYLKCTPQIKHVGSCFPYLSHAGPDNTSVDGNKNHFQ